MNLVERPKNVDWRLWKRDDGFAPEWIQLAILMDIRDELRRLNNLLLCPNFQMIPSMLRRIQANTSKSKRKLKSKAAAKS